MCNVLCAMYYVYVQCIMYVYNIMYSVLCTCIYVYYVHVHVHVQCIMYMYSVLCTCTCIMLCTVYYVHV